MATLMFTPAWRRTAPAEKPEFRRGCFKSARATSATSKSVMVRLTPRKDSMTGRRSSRTWSNAPASTSRTRKKWGTLVQLWVVRSAMRRATELSGSGSAGEAADFAAAASTSSEVTVPSGPLPRKPPMSTPFSAASRRALGEILALFSLLNSGAVVLPPAMPALAGAPAGRVADSGAGVSGGIGSPWATIQAMV